MRKSEARLTAIDLFCGAGGLSLGLRQAGFDIVAAVELDSEIAKTYAINHPGTTLICKDVRKTTGRELLKAGNVKSLDLVAGCPPCQGFSKLTIKYRKKDPRNDLLLEMGRIVEETRPKMIMVENVPGLMKKGKPVLDKFVAKIKSLGYIVNMGVLQMADYGVPQMRRRFVLLAGAGFAIELPEPTHSRKGDREKGLKLRVTLAEALKNVKHKPVGFIKAQKSGGVAKFKWHVVSDLTDLSKKRLAALREGQNRRDLPKALRPACHQESDDGFENVYGRMKWNIPSPTITSGCTTPCAGRFGHPSELRAISIREAALIQTFPKGYKFKTVFISKAAIMVGNALPVKFAKIAGTVCAEAHLRHSTEMHKYNN